MNPSDAAKSVRSGRRTALRAATAVASLGVAVAVLELGARAWMGDAFVSGARTVSVERAIGRHDPEIGWVLAPRESVDLQSGTRAWRATTNELGFRGPVLAAERTAGVRRIVVIGDSFTYGWGVDDGESYCDLLAADPRLRCEVANFGVPGYSTDQELWTFERHGARLRPDLVVLQFCDNDLLPNRSARGHGLVKPVYLPVPGGDWSLVGRPVPDFLAVRAGERSWGSALASRSAIWSAARRVRHHGTWGAPVEAPWDELSAPVTEMILRRLVAACNAVGAPLVVFHAFRPDLIRDDDSRGDHLAACSRALLPLSYRVGFVLAPVDRAIAEAAARGEAIMIPGDAHWNENGHRIAAETLAPELARILGR